MHVTSKSGRVFDLPNAEEEAHIREGIAADPDARELSDDDMTRLRPLGRPKADATKQAISIRLSPEVIAYFKAGGPGWQTRIDAVLREYVASH
ncbi:MAG: hypothetical protein GVY22_07560 [Gammaproteobacteria bacterium]|jgi:uncharacterized protein (DUF4415 family)|nr:hypothetical protein [Gammaproteobacteria bacterium]